MPKFIKHYCTQCRQNSEWEIGPRFAKCQTKGCGMVFVKEIILKPYSKTYEKKGSDQKSPTQG